jgi:hypothetical protein
MRSVTYNLRLITWARNKIAQRFLSADQRDRVMPGGGAGSRDEFGPMARTRRRRLRADLVLGLLLLKQNPSDKSRG